VKKPIGKTPKPTWKATNPCGKRQNHLDLRSIHRCGSAVIYIPSFFSIPLDDSTKTVLARVAGSGVFSAIDAEDADEERTILRDQDLDGAGIGRNGSVFGVEPLEFQLVTRHVENLLSSGHG
jgi:hypothetical protein